MITFDSISESNRYSRSQLCSNRCVPISAHSHGPTGRRAYPTNICQPNGPLPWRPSGPAQPEPRPSTILLTTPTYVTSPTYDAQRQTPQRSNRTLSHPTSHASSQSLQNPKPHTNYPHPKTPPSEPNHHTRILSPAWTNRAIRQPNRSASGSKCPTNRTHGQTTERTKRASREPECITPKRVSRSNVPNSRREYASSTNGTERYT